MGCLWDTTVRILQRLGSKLPLRVAHALCTVRFFSLFRFVHVLVKKQKRKPYNQILGLWRNFFEGAFSML